jgi:hypothetical protein
MRWIKQAFAFYVFGNIHVGLAAYCLTKITFLQYGIENQALANFIFFSTVLSYNLIRWFQVDRISSIMSLYFKSKSKYLILLNMIALAGSIYSAIDFGLTFYIPLIPLSLATILYVFPVKKGVSGLRFVPGLKLFLISFIWAGVTFFLPVFNEGIWYDESMIVYFVQRLLFVLAITIPFDIRDAEFDSQELSTLPQIIGVGASKITAIAALVIYMVIARWSEAQFPISFWVDALVMSVSIVLISFSGRRRSRYFTAFWIEGIPVFWYLLCLMAVNKIVF